MRVLVIGGTGHIGSHLIPMLLKDGHEVSVVARGQTESYVPGDHWREVRRINLDRRVDEASGRWADALANVSADVVVDIVGYEPAGTELLYSLFRGRIEQLVHIGTCWEYGVVRTMPTPESHPLSGENEYARKKAAIARFLLERFAAEQFPATILRATQITGPGKVCMNPLGNWQPEVWQRVADGGEFFLPGDGNTPLQPVHAADCARGVMAVIRRRGAAVGQAFNLAGARSLTYNGLLELGARFFGSDVRPVHVPLPEFEQRWGLSQLSRDMLKQPVCVDIAKLRALGYEPAFTAEDTVRDALRWMVREGRVKAPSVGA